MVLARNVLATIVLSCFIHGRSAIPIEGLNIEQTSSTERNNELVSKEIVPSDVGENERTLQGPLALPSAVAFIAVAAAAAGSLVALDKCGKPGYDCTTVEGAVGAAADTVGDGVNGAVNVVSSAFDGINFPKGDEVVSLSEEVVEEVITTSEEAVEEGITTSEEVVEDDKKGKNKEKKSKGKKGGRRLESRNRSTLRGSHAKRS